jgi:hypothetical protein
LQVSFGRGRHRLVVAVAHTSTPLLGRLVYRSADSEALAMVRDDPALAKAIDRQLQRLERRATALVTRHARAVIRIADALMIRRYLTGEETSDFFRAARPSPAPSKHSPKR